MACAAGPQSTKILCWNIVWGRLSEKLDRIHEQETTKDFDIICLVEAYKSKCPTDDFDLPRFDSVYLENKGKQYNTRMGGLAVYANKDFPGTVEVVSKGKNDREGLLKWFKVSRRCSSGTYCFYLCVVYAPGPGSNYWGSGGNKQKTKEKEFFDMIADVADDYREQKEMVVLVGDFNCRIGHFQDRNSPDEDLMRHVEFQKLVEDCDLHIVNGRSDRSLRHDVLIDLEATCYHAGKEPTVVDYALVSNDHKAGVQYQIGGFGKSFELQAKGGVSDHRSLSLTVSKPPAPVPAPSEAKSSPAARKPPRRVETTVTCDGCGVKEISKAELSEAELDLLRELGRGRRRLRLFCPECEELVYCQFDDFRSARED